MREKITELVLAAVQFADYLERFIYCNIDLARSCVIVEEQVTLITVP